MLCLLNLKVHKNAFTLAEILIALGIIGVIAALTMPPLITKYQHKVLESQFKTAYSIFSRATQKVFLENPEFIDVFENTGKINTAVVEANAIYTRKVFVDILKAEEKTASDLPLRKFKSYHNESAIWSDPFNTHSGTNLETTKEYNGNYYYRLPNGMIFKLHTIVWSLVNDSNVKFTIASIAISVDTNGFYKGPNRSGFDNFTFFIKGDRMLSGDGYCYLVPSTSYIGSGNSQLSADCVNKRSTLGSSNSFSMYPDCAAYAIKDRAPMINTSTLKRAETNDYWKNLPK